MNWKIIYCEKVIHTHFDHNNKLCQDVLHNTHAWWNTHKRNDNALKWMYLVDKWTCPKCGYLYDKIVFYVNSNRVILFRQYSSQCSVCFFFIAELCNLFLIDMLLKLTNTNNTEAFERKLISSSSSLLLFLLLLLYISSATHKK